MRIRRLKLANFRGVANGEVVFPGHTVIIGGNSVGKSTLCEALDLLLGPDRLSRSSPIDEHDFFERRYLDEGGISHSHRVGGGPDRPYGGRAHEVPHTPGVLGHSDQPFQGAN